MPMKIRTTDGMRRQNVGYNLFKPEQQSKKVEQHIPDNGSHISNDVKINPINRLLFIILDKNNSFLLKHSKISNVVMNVAERIMNFTNRFSKK